MAQKKGKQCKSTSSSLNTSSSFFSNSSLALVWFLLGVTALVWRMPGVPQLFQGTRQPLPLFADSPDEAFVKAPKANWKTFVITMDTSTPRFGAFTSNNPLLAFEVFLGIRGSLLSCKEKIREGIMTQDLSDHKLFTDGLLGATMSHRTLWERCVQEGVPFLIIEDDAITHPQLSDFINYHFEQLATKVDFLSFTTNTDSFLASLTPEGLLVSQTFPKDHHPTPQRIHALLNATSLHRVELRRLVAGFGIPCYFITPHGAKFFLEHLFPLSLELVFETVQKEIPGYCLSARAIRYYPEISAFVTHPFLAFSPNSDSSTKPKSLVQNRMFRDADER